MRNIFILSTEYHFLIVMSVIHRHFSTDQWSNVLVFGGIRLNEVNIESCPPNITIEKLSFKNEPNFKARIHSLIDGDDLSNVFVFHAYRPLETYVLCSVPSAVRRHLLQDGGVFYNLRERSEFLSRLHVTFNIYKDLFKKGIWLKKIVLYKKFQQQSQYIDCVWVTHPDLYLEPRVFRKPIKQIVIPQSQELIDTFSSYFSLQGKYSDFIIYLAPKIYEPHLVDKEIEQIKMILRVAKKEKLLIKLHPAARDFQVRMLKENFEAEVVRNGIPAEMYIANASNSYIIGAASTALFYHNPTCKYYALKKYYMSLGLYARWSNIILPPHVKVISALDEIGL